MHPPIDPNVFNKNPRFAALHRQLIGACLAEDGSTIPKTSQKAREIFEKELKTSQVELLEEHWLRESLVGVTFEGSKHSDELHESLEVVLALLNNDISRHSDPLLEDDIEFFKYNVADVALQLSEIIERTFADLCSLVIPSNDSTIANDAEAALPSILAQKKQSNTTAISKLLSKRLVLLETTQSILSTQAALVEAIVQDLEQIKCGSLSRAVKARVDHLATVAEGMELKLRIFKYEALQIVYDAETLSALSNYNEHLRDTLMRIEQRERRAQETLGRYTEGGSNMREISAKYAALLRSVETVKSDIKKLGGDAKTSQP